MGGAAAPGTAADDADDEVDDDVSDDVDVVIGCTSAGDSKDAPPGTCTTTRACCTFSVEQLVNWWVGVR